jgi:hypothetical protein
MGTDAVTLIRNDHRLLESLFQRLQEGGRDRRALVDEIAARLTAHAQAEEEEVYPAITAADPAEEDEVEHAYHEHDEAMHLLLKVVNLVDSPHFDQAVTDLVKAVRHHVDEEESEVLPALGDAGDGRRWNVWVRRSTASGRQRCAPPGSRTCGHRPGQRPPENSGTRRGTSCTRGPRRPTLPGGRA